MNGVFVNTEGDVYVLINDSPYKVDASATPFGRLSPGTYTDAEAAAAIAKLPKQSKFEQLLEGWAAKFDPNQPRVPAGSPEGGQFGEGTGAAAAAKPAATTTDSTVSAKSLTAAAITRSTPAAKPNSRGVEVVSKELNNRAGDILEKQFGKRSIEGPDPKTDEYLANVVANDIKESLQGGNASPTWYSDTMKEAMDVATSQYPELGTDQDARFAYRVGLAIPSQGERVDSTARLADEAYKQYRDTGKFPEKLNVATPAINENFKKVNNLIDEMGGVANVRQFFDSEMTRKELDPIYKVPGTLVDAKVNGSAVLGPKIGMGFYQNLRGNFEPLTMDLWFMRTWGRITNTGFGERNEDKLSERLTNAMQAAGMTIPKPGAPDDFGRRGGLKEAAQNIMREHERRYKVDAEYRGKKPEIAFAADRYLNPGMQDSPRGGKQRKWMTDVYNTALNKLAKEGINLTPAAAQATVWNPEQQLFKHMGARVSDVDRDYAKALRKLYGKMTKQEQTKLQYAPWADDPDPPDYMTDEEIKAWAKRVAAWWRNRKAKGAST